MTDRPVIFSAPMIRALLAGRKTQTRRLATSPLSKCQPGDRLWVREAWVKHVSIPQVCGYRADGGRATEQWEANKTARYMPRYASRLVLTVADVRFQALRDLTAPDAIAEGLLSTTPGELRRHGYTDDEGGPPCPPEWPDNACLWAAPNEAELNVLSVDPCAAYIDLWRCLHPDGEDNPPIVALTFTVARCNIDAGGSA